MGNSKKNCGSERFLLLWLMAASLFLFLACAQLSASVKLNPVDRYFFLVCNYFTIHFAVPIALFISLFGTAVFLIPAYILIVHFLIKTGREKYAVLVITTATTSLLSGWLLKYIFRRHRPPMPLVQGAGWYSFPSGHALGAFTFSGICIFLLWQSQIRRSRKRSLSFLFFAFGSAIGLSRIYLHVHYATDVIGAMFFFGVFSIIHVYDLSDCIR